VSERATPKELENESGFQLLRTASGGLKKKQISTDKIEVKSMTGTQLTIDSGTYYYETLLPMQGGRLPGIRPL
jgi:hypothetical protein